MAKKIDIYEDGKVIKTFNNSKDFWDYQSKNPNLQPEQVALNDMIFYGWDEIEGEI